MGYGDSYEDDGYGNEEQGGSLVPERTYRARGVRGSAQLGMTNNGNPQMAAAFEIIDDTHGGKTVPWYGHFTERTEKRTLESLRLAGWSNDDIGEIEGFGDTEVDIVVEHNTWEGKTSARVAWVNRAGSGGLALKSPMNEAQRKAFAAKMKGKAVQSRQASEREKPKAPPTKPAPRKPAPPVEEREPGSDDDLQF